MKKLMHAGLVTALAILPFPAFAENITPNLKFNGFATASTAWLDNDQGGEYLRDLRGHSGFTESPDFGLESLIGVQFDYLVNDQTHVTTQLLSKGRNDYNTQAEWAYISRTLTDNLTLRAGRFTLPLYMYSESIHVGQSYPWVRLPVETYERGAITNFDGVDLLHRQQLGDWNLNTRVLTGSADTKLSFGGLDVVGKLKSVAGINLNLSNDNLTLRAGYVEGKLDVTMPVGYGLSALDIKDEPIGFAGLGAMYDDGQWFLASELSHFRMGGWWPDSDSGYVSVGHHAGKWLPYVTASKANTLKFDECVAIGPLCSFVTPHYREQTTYALGVNYALSPTVSLKGQVDHVTDFNNSTGYFFSDSAPSTTPDAFNVFTLSMTASF